MASTGAASNGAFSAAGLTTIHVFVFIIESTGDLETAFGTDDAARAARAL